MRRNEDGFVLMDLAVSLPVLVLLAGALGALALFASYRALHLYAEAELRWEMQDAMMRMVEDASKAARIEKAQYANGPALKIWFRDIEGKKKGDARVPDAVYFVNVEGRTKKLVYQNVHFPITGNSNLAEVVIKRFAIDPAGKDLMKVTLEGESYAARRMDADGTRRPSTYRLESYVRTGGGT